jgi:sugar O-acyltransferase (sialic acid O-acetyltransferase NeuD family)
MAKLVIFGAGDIARLADYYFSRDSDHEVVAFTVDAAFRKSDTFLERPLVDFAEVAFVYPPETFKMFVALSYASMNLVRKEKYEAVKGLGYELVSYVSSRCSYLSECPPGDNCFVLEDNTIQPFVRIGNNVTLWSGNHVGHDSVVGDHCFISSHVVISGHVQIGERCFLGVNATLRDNIRIAAATLIGAGAAIMKDTVEKGVYVPQKSKRLTMTSDRIKL